MSDSTSGHDMTQIDDWKNWYFEASKPCPVCRYEVWTQSAETGLKLFCAVCDARDRARDFQGERDRYRKLLEQIANHQPVLLRDPSDEGYHDYESEYEKIQSLARTALKG